MSIAAISGKIVNGQRYIADGRSKQRPYNTTPLIVTKPAVVR
jgi:hypothetical protein